MSTTPGSQLPLSSPAPLGPVARTGNTSFATSICLLVLRVFIGWTFFFHGSQKLFGTFHGPGIQAFSTMVHLPVLSPILWAYIAACGEFFGGVFIFFGLLTRLATLPIIVVMLVAIATVTGRNGFSLPMGYEYNVAIIAIVVGLLIAGPGMISLDALLFRRGLWARGPQPLANPATRP